MKKYYDPEYDRIVTEKIVKEQYEYFKKEMPYAIKDKTFEQFAMDNFVEIKEGENEEEVARKNYCIPEIIRF